MRTFFLILIICALPFIGKAQITSLGVVAGLNAVANNEPFTGLSISLRPGYNNLSETLN